MAPALNYVQAAEKMDDEGGKGSIAVPCHTDAVKRLALRVASTEEFIPFSSMMVSFTTKADRG